MLLSGVDLSGRPASRVPGNSLVTIHSIAVGNPPRFRVQDTGGTMISIRAVVRSGHPVIRFSSC